MDRIKNYISDHPEVFGIFFILVGVGLLIAAWMDANWLFGDVNSNTYSLKKLDGWVNMFGRKTARVVAGIMSIIIVLAGVVWFWAYSSMK